jgi:hypothetical protein
MSTWVLSSGVKRPRREDGHSTQSSAEAKYESSYASTPAVRLHDVHMDKFTLAFTFRDHITDPLFYAEGYATLMTDPTVRRNCHMQTQFTVIVLLPRKNNSLPNSTSSDYPED